MRNLIIILTLISSISHAANTSDSTIVAEMRHVIDGKSPMTIIKSTIEIEETKYSEFSGIPDNNYRKITTCNFKKIEKGLTVVTGRQDNGRCFCIMDMNGNRDFSDDYCYYFRPERIDESETFARQPLMYDTPDGQKGGLWVAPYLAWNEETDRRDINDLHCYIEYGHQFESDINIDGKDFHINIYPIGEKYYEYNINNTSPSSLSANVPLRIGDVCFYLSDINEAQQTCKIRVIQTDGINIPFAPNKDFKAPLFECKDIKGKTFSLEKQKGKRNHMEITAFSELQLDSRILRAVEEMGFEEATPIQAQAIPVQMEGRVMDHMRRKTIRCDQIHTVIMDEADEMLNMGFLEDMETILSQLPDSPLLCMALDLSGCDAAAD